ncbi:sensor domain-containing protein [Haloechinothrix sp. YIM 98757]|uniref:Sensor domain-containing protein n=1 Tax=Haloechinothrix aidingensis TaxID=2752311 RepID=A0A838ABF2_9PSEU|nr:sensor domain-containing protein [Haloechinothrix aidingensis]MBA0126535.1 sensor domain-containing protein [Haloechinothrix aidingensis]
MTRTSPHPATERTGDRPATGRPPVLGSLAFLLLNLPLGVFWFSLLVSLIAVSAGTAVIWVGLVTGAATVLLWRGGAVVERARVHALLGTAIAEPYRELPDAPPSVRWKARLRDTATWKDLGYLLALFPVGILEFVLMVTTWSTSLALVGLPIYYRFLPGGAYHFPGYDPGHQWFTVDSVADALPFAIAGAVAVLVTVALTRALGASHARFARSMLGTIPASAA